LLIAVTGKAVDIFLVWGCNWPSEAKPAYSASGRPRSEAAGKFYKKKSFLVSENYLI
jgi:hypothetical protein